MQPLKLLSSSNSWGDLNKKLEEFTKSNQSKLAGDIFENVCKYFLQTAPQYQTKLKNVWLLKEVKEDLRRKLNLPSTDEGIDLIAKTFDGKYWAIQSKYRSDPKDTLTVKGDLATFANLAFNNCKNISLGLVMTTADKPPLKTKLLKGVSFVTLESFLELDDNNFEGWKLITAKAEHKTIIPKALSPRPHQVKAIKNTIEYFKTKERGKVIMPCGTGKSLTAFWIANELKAKSVLIAVPSLALLQQTLKVWTREYLIAGIKPDWLCVCSDQTVSDDQDDFVSNIYELGIDVTTDKNEIKKFLKSKANTKVVFTTYQSGKVTAQGAKGFTFDLGIMDEAHKTVGLGTKPMAHLIHQKNIKIKHRLFMTATERLFRGDKEEYLSMDDPRDYGDLIYQLSFKEAIEAKPPIISDYKIITFGISEPEIEAVYQDNKFIRIKREIDDIKAREFATALALRKAIKKLGIRNAISFHSSIRRANNFKAQQELISKVYPEYGNLKAFHVSGDMPTNQRSSQMREFAESKGLMTNARCLTEGVDLPAIDCVVFTDPKKSKVDIVQAAGRALRLSPGKKFGYILIPLIIPENENATEAAKDTAFEEIVATIRALATQDTRIIEYLRAVSSGTIPKGGSPVDGITKINVLTKVNEEEFNKSIQLKVWDRVAFGNYRSYEEAKKYALSLNLSGKQKWVNYTKKNKIPLDIPKSPRTVYKKLFEGWGNFLGTGYIANRVRKYKNFEDAKNYVHRLGIKSQAEWLRYLNKNKIIDIPSFPNQTYSRTKEWKGWGDFLGTGSLSNIEKNKIYKNYNVVKKYIKKLNFKNQNDWKKFTKSNNFPNNFPKYPEQTYKRDKSWKGWGDFLSTGFISTQKRIYVSYEKAKKYAHSLNLKSFTEWKKLFKEKKIPNNIPSYPQQTYKDKFEGAGIFLGTGIVPVKDRNYVTYSRAKKYAQSLKLKNRDEWFKNTKTANFPNNIPAYPEKIYKDEFEGIGTFLGTGFVAFKYRKYLSYDKAKKFLRTLDIKDQGSWKRFTKSKKFPRNIPMAPWLFYKKDFEGLAIFLGNKNLRGKNFITFEEARKYARSLKLKSISEWYKYFKSEKFNKKIPYTLERTYKDKWKGWSDFLGTSRRPRTRKS